ncbi:MAG: preprotein translocase subunit SecA [Nitrospirae bacterium]|nr:preprotein translocase subunit SecA [Nitrospirota bacterium]
MITSLLSKIIGTKNDREIKRIQPIVGKVAAFEPALRALSDEALRGKTDEFKGRLAKGETLDGLMPEAFAVAREAGRRVLGMRHFDVQLIGGVVLHEGNIAEMRTGEGKTLVATLPVYLNALTGKGVHVVTVNDYLAKRDSQWMGEIYRFLGLTVGVVVHELDDRQRQEAYRCDVTYGTNNEFGFDYLRDNMKFDLANYVQRELNYAIVDEVDSILIDEARTPLIISGPSEESTDLYYNINQIIPRLRPEEHYTIEEKTKTAALTEEGNALVEKLLNINNLYDPENIETLHHVNQALRAHTLYRLDVDYVVKDGEVIIVDDFTGRLMPGRRWSDGLHQAVEAKEGVKIAAENQTLATITFQNYFRMYNKLAGMTGTADTEAPEFAKIYNLDVLVIPTNMPMVRKDNADQVYKTMREKYNAVVDDIIACHERQQPVLVGTISIEKSELISSLLKKKGVKHNVLNAKYHEREAEIVAQAGRAAAVTIATNMAGRGTDILLGGNPKLLAREVLVRRDIDPEEATPEQWEEAMAAMKSETEAGHKTVVEAGGLHIIGTERHESRRIDNQLRGRAGRQGDPGSTRFYLSLEDDLMRIFGSDRIAGIMNKLGMEEGVPIEHGMVSKAIENAQKKVEAHNFDIRKQLIEYDDVMNKQRTVIYEQRRQVLGSEDLKDDVLDMVADTAPQIVNTFCEQGKHAEEWDHEGLAVVVKKQFGVDLDVEALKTQPSIESLSESLSMTLREAYENKEKEVGTEFLRWLEKRVLLDMIDSHWKNHLQNMDHLKDGIGLRGYGQKDPLVEYKREGFDMFMHMVDSIKTDTLERLFLVQLVRQEAMEKKVAPRPQRLILNRGDDAGVQQPVKSEKTAGRNDPCPCGSGKKYKKCCGK